MTDLDTALAAIAEALREPVVWTRQEKGWSTSVLGGVCKDQGGWWFWPIDESKRIGPFWTEKEAKQAAEEGGK